MINNQAALFLQTLPSQNAVSMNYCNSQVSYYLPINSSLAPFAQYPQSQEQLCLQSMQNSSASQSQINRISQNHLNYGNMIAIHSQQQIPQTIQGIQYSQQNIPCFQVLAPSLKTFDQNNQQNPAITWTQPIVQQSSLQNQCELQYQFPSQLLGIQQFQQQQQLQQSLQYQNLLQQQQMLAYQQQKQCDYLRLQENSQFQGQQTHPSQQELQECQSFQPQESHHLQQRQSQTQIERVQNIQQKSSQELIPQDTHEEIIFSQNKNQQSHSTLPPQQSSSVCGGKCPKTTKIIQKLKQRQFIGEVTLKDKKQTKYLRTSNYQKIDSLNKNSDNLNQKNNTDENAKRQLISSQQKASQSSSLIAAKKLKIVRIKKQQANEDTVRYQEDQFKLSLIEKLQPAMKEIVNLSIQMNRLNINRNLIKAFRKYVHENVKYTLNYEKLSASQYHFKSCQNLPIIINNDPNDKEREMFRKKFNKFIGSKQHSNNDLKQIIENRLYSILFKEFLQVEIGELISLNGDDKQSDINVAIQFYLLCLREPQYIVFLNDSLTLNKKNALCFIAASNGIAGVQSHQHSELGSRSSTIIHPTEQQESQKIIETSQLLPTNGGFEKLNAVSNEISQIDRSELVDSPQEKSQHQNKEMDVQMMASKTLFLEETNKTESPLKQQKSSYESIEKEQINDQGEVNNQYQKDQSHQKVSILAQELFEFHEEPKNCSI